jgi:branched-subunit amino acid aminotransferase/4-amino-4-deoxychorismate lyase
MMSAHEVFVTNSLLGVVPVSAIDARTYPVAQSGVTHAVRAAFERAALA